MASVNKVILIGNLGKDPEVRYTNSGQAVASFSLATSEKFKNKQGELTDQTEWHNLQMWGKLAEIAGEYLSKGKTIYVEGRLQTRKWQDKSGNDRYTTEIVCDKMQMLSPKGEKGDKSSTGNNTSCAGGSGYGEPPFNPDEYVPFN